MTNNITETADEQETYINLCHEDAVNLLNALEKPKATTPRFLESVRQYKEQVNTKRGDNDQTRIPTQNHHKT